MTSDHTADETVDVVFRAVPVALYVELQSHNDSVLRDLVLRRSDGAMPNDEPLSAMDASLLEWRERLRLRVDHAQSEGRSHVDLEATYLRSAVEPFRRYVAMLEEADQAAARGELLVPMPSADVVALRRWLVYELGAQAFEGAEPTPFCSPDGSRGDDHTSR